jgi:hypothetical protein
VVVPVVDAVSLVTYIHGSARLPFEEETTSMPGLLMASPELLQRLRLSGAVWNRPIQVCTRIRSSSAAVSAKGTP